MTFPEEKPPAPECPMCSNSREFCTCEPAQDGPREWFVDINEWHGVGGIAFNQAALDEMEMSSTKMIHVIEKSAYLQVKSERDDALSVLAGVEEQAKKNSNYDEWRIDKVIIP